MNRFASHFKELREEKCLSQIGLAKELGFTQSAVAKWESGDREPEYDVLIAIARYFGVTTDYLLGLED